MQFRIVLLATAGLASMPFSCWASDRGSMEDQLACTPDVYRLCSQFVPDEDAIVACLQRNIAALSPGCHKVFSAPPSAPGQTNDEDQ